MIAKCVLRAVFIGLVMGGSAANSVRAQEGGGPPSAAPGGAQEGPKIARVTVTREGINRDDAIKQALRAALEQGAGTQLAAYSKTENYQLMRDAIFTRASGIVKEYQIIKEENSADGAVSITINAVVSNDAVARAWGEVQNVLDQLGRPTISIIIVEKIDGEIQEMSMVENRLSDFFRRQGFVVKDRSALDEIARRETGDALEVNNVAKVQRFVKDAGANIFIHGFASADRGGMESLYDMPVVVYNCSVQAKLYYTDTAEVIASAAVPFTPTRLRGNREFNPQAARLALEAATFPNDSRPGQRMPLALDLYGKAMEHWAEQITAGGNLELEVENLNFGNYAAIKKALEELRSKDNDLKLAGEFTRGTGIYKIKTRLSAENFAMLLTEEPFKDWLDVKDLKLNRIQAVAKSKAP